jgi:hypothetical protein
MMNDELRRKTAYLPPIIDRSSFIVSSLLANLPPMP